jgi:hypothetical protein
MVTVQFLPHYLVQSECLAANRQFQGDIIYYPPGPGGNTNAICYP